MKKAALGIIALAMSFMATTAHAATGDIRSIFPCDLYGNQIDPGTMATAKKAGETVYFCVRLENSDSAQCYEKGGANPWGLKYAGGVYDLATALILTPPAVGIYVSGRLTAAKVVSIGAPVNKPWYTDIVCAYTVKPGDMAFPVTLALANGNEVGKEESPEYYFDTVPRTYSWSLFSYEHDGYADGKWGNVIATNTCTFAYGASSVFNNGSYSAEINSWKKDTDLRKAGLYVKTVDFALQEDVVPEGDQKPIVVNIEGGANTNGIGVVYAMVRDDAPVSLAGNGVETVEFPDSTNHPEMEGKYQVVAVTIPSGADISSFSFNVKGEEKSDNAATIYLATTKGFVLDGGGKNMITNFITASVKCGNPLLPHITATLKPDSTVTSGPNYKTNAAILTVTLSKAYTSDVTVVVSPTMFSGSGTEPLGKYIGMSTYPENGFSETTTNVNFLVDDMSNGTLSKDLYVYVLGADGDTDGIGKGIKFTPAATGAAANFFTGENKFATLSIKKSTPQILYPIEDDPETDNDDFRGLNGGVYSEFTIKVSDDYTNMQSDFIVEWDKTGSGKWEKLPAAVPDENGEITVKVRYNAGDYTTRFRVINASGVYSETRTIKVHVSPTKRVYAEFESHDGNTEFGEDEGQVELRFKLSEAYDTTLYAFLVPQDAVSSNYVKTTAFTRGISIQSGSTNSSTTAKIQLLDGNDDTLPLLYDIVLRTDRSWDSGETISVYEAQDVEIYVHNVAPVIDNVGMTGSAEVEESGDTFTGKAAIGLPKGFYVKLNDVEADLTNVYETVWTFSTPGSGSLASVKKSGTAAELGDEDAPLVTKTFNIPGIYSCTVKVKDKDMMSGTKYSETFKFNVEVLPTPYVYITQDKSATNAIELITFDEKSAETGDASIWVKLSTPAPKPLDVMLEVSSKGTDGVLNIINKKVSFKVEEYEKLVYIDELDGTVNTALRKGAFEISASVVTTTPNDDGTPLCEVYESSAVEVLVLNSAPVIAMPFENSTTNPAPRNAQMQFKWKIDDVASDLTNGLEIVWTTSENKRYPEIGSVTGAEGVYTNVFDNTGAKWVRISVTDKDGALAERTLYYFVEPSKIVKVNPILPYKGGAQTPMSQRYESAAGRGAGRVYANATVSVKGFGHEYVLDKSASDVELYAWGYKSGQKDDGNLYGGLDVGIDPNGDSGKSGDYYVHNDNYDSFFYAWMVITEDPETGSASGVPLVAPVNPFNADSPVRYNVNLPLEQSGDASSPVFPNRVVEAFFAREKFQSDNMGDMNADGIPDYFATKTWTDATGALKTIPEAQTGQAISGSADGGAGASGGTSSSDLANVDAYNGDGDFLPVAASSVNPLKPEPENRNWGPGTDFTAYREIRGFSDGLNEPGVSDYDLSEAESNSLFAACAIAGAPAADYAAATNWAVANGWTPEAVDPVTKVRLNPLSADTDGDGFDDGWEYYFWYYAKHGAVTNGVWGRLEGRRFHLSAPASGSRISPDEIVAAFDPHMPRNKEVLFGKDFDNDGLSDLEEYVLGTNPCDWDSDGDGMSDLWEVLYGLNPCYADSDANPDYDFMARMEYGADTFTVYTFADGSAYALPAATASSVSPAEDETLEMHKIETVSDKPAVYWSATLPVTYVSASATILASDVQCRANLSYGGKSYLGAEAVLPAGTPVTVTGTSEPVLLARLPETGFGWTDPNTLELSSTKKALKVFNYGCDGVTYVPCTSNITEYSDVPLSEDIVAVADDVRMVLIHDQVCRTDGFDPRVAWNIDENGFLANRWRKEDSEDAAGPGDTGKPVNTVAYSSRDEYLLLQYRQQALVSDYPDLSSMDGMQRLDAFRDYTTFPNVPISFVKSSQYQAIHEPFTITNKTFQAYWDELNKGVLGQDADYVGTHGADTDNDGVPDGWELYVRCNPNSQADSSLHIDNDKLSLAQEFAGVDSCNAYTNRYIGGFLVCPSATTIAKNHPGKTDNWWNKFFPTNPHADDTDGDGLSDHQERDSWSGTLPVGRRGYSAKFTFSYAENGDEYAGDSKSICFRGGGLNPCTVDTDGDLLPDAWEYQFAGIVFNGSSTDVALDANDLRTLCAADEHQTGVKDGEIQIRGGMDGTFSGDADWDFDHDGLLNFQEYLVQSLRHLRYDDSKTPLMGVDPVSGNFVRFLPFSAWDGTAFHNKCRTSGFPGLKAWDFRSLGYFALPPHKWDMTALKTAGLSQCSNYKHSEGAGYRVMLRPVTDIPGASLQAAGYASTDPRKWDTDQDGMDDYYEIFHGLNPLLGSSADPDALNENGFYNYEVYDVIASIYGGYTTSWRNQWTQWSSAQPTFDAIKHPWMIGTMECDADGDGLRNDEESLKVNVANPNNTHTDPTPLWMTDSTSDKYASFTSQYYSADPYLAEVPEYDPLTTHHDLYCYPWKDLRWNTVVFAPGSGGINRNWMFSFEENEGYDTDHDFTRDATELQKGIEGTSDPQMFMDPNRRQALYLPGLKDGIGSAAASYDSEFRRSVGTEPDLFKQFTVECWVRPDGAPNGAVIVERVCNYGASTLLNATPSVRANFRIGVNGEGCVYGEFEGTTSDSGSVLAVGQKLPADVWTHVAFTFDGNLASLYMNGEVAPVATVSGAGLLPANGIDGILQEEGGSVMPYTGYRALPCAVVLGAKALNADAVSISAATTWDDFCANSYFKGWIDEVRIWDGARSSADIHADYLKRYSFADVSAKRDEVYKSWANGGRRYSSDAKAQLPVELLYHYNFASLPGGVEPNNVLTAPSGFKSGVLDNVRRPDGKSLVSSLAVGWWSRISGVNSSVYRDQTIVPWIANTVAHLPHLDGSSPDSLYWSANFAGVIGTEYSGVDSYYYPNTANPYPYYVYRFERLHHLNRLIRSPFIGVYDNGTDSAHARYEFQLRSASVGTSDLVPLGGAFAKRGTDYWDGDGAMDAWLLTSKDYETPDANADGIPDWAAALGFSADDPEAFVRAVAAGLLPGAAKSNAYDKAYADVADANHDGLADWWQRLYDLKGVASDDTDQDGLADFAEYLVSDVFKFAKISPKLTKTDGNEFDYFLKAGKLYLGEMFSDHDMMEDSWEALFADSVTDTAKYDPHGDADFDGWSNFAECRAGTLPDRTASIVIGSDELPEYPVPAIKVKAHYAKAASVTAPIIIKAYSSSSRNAEADAVWTVPGSSVAMDCELPLGLNPGVKTSVNLGCGSVVPGSVYLLMRDPSELSVSDAGGVWQSPGGTTWREVLTETVIPGNQDVANLSKVRDPVGTINYATGIAEIDFSAMLGYVYYNIEAGVYSFSPPNTNVYMRLDMANSYAKIRWKSIRVPGEAFWNFMLSKPVSGHVREGVNRFEAFIDLDGNGLFTPGEPFGMTRDVDVGWNSSSFDIEMTDTSHTVPRMVFELDNDELTLSRNTRVSVYRESVDGLKSTYDGTILNPFVGNYDIGSREYVHEGDFLGNGFDIDWENFTKDVMNSSMVQSGLSVTSVVYRVAVETRSDSTEHCYSNTYEIVRRFTSRHLTATPCNNNVICYGARPVFRWKYDSSVPQSDWDTFTAFSIQVSGASGALWNSGVRMLPPRLPDGTFEWTAPICVNDVVGKGKVFNNLENYTWKISLHNSKYQSASWSAAQDFRMNVYDEEEANSAGHGSIKLAVKYFGPGAFTISSSYSHVIRAEAFKTPDFTGDPCGSAWVRGRGSVTDGQHNVNATIIGLEPGSYYVRAYIDSNGNMRRDDFESWGYVCPRGDTATKAMFTPMAIQVGAGLVAAETLYVEDVDTDQDGLPDVWEYDEASGIGDFLAAKKPVKNGTDGYISVNTDLVDTITRPGSPGAVVNMFSTGMTSMQSDLVALSLGIDTAENTLEASTLAIKAISLVDGAVNLTVGAAANEPDLGTLYVKDNTVTATVVISYSDSLDGEWNEKDFVKTFEITDGSVGCVLTITKEELEKQCLDTSKGFFKVRLK